MRGDMFKVIVERPRRAPMGKPSGRRPRDLEDLPSKQSMRRHQGYYGKELNEHLAPLRRYLGKQVGRPWNQVYSDICRNLRAGHPIHDHVRRHVFDYVDVDHPLAQNRFIRNKMYYVDRRTGLLRKSKHLNRKSR
jgi:hypothetical protein